MKLVSILSGNGFVLYNKDIARSLSVNSAIIFGQVCASYESFEKKGMLTIRDGKEYFFLTSETLEEETALTYKLQLKATKELEEAGYIETKVMGVPSKKYFHITDKIVKELLADENPSSTQTEDLKDEEDSLEQDSADLSFSKREHLALPKETGKLLPNGSTIKNKNIKIKNKNNYNNLVNKESVNNDEIINNLISQYRLKGLSKELCLRVLEEVNSNPDVHNFGGYFRTCLENALYRHKVKHRRIDPAIRLKERLKNSSILFYNWLEDDNDELPY